MWCRKWCRKKSGLKRAAVIVNVYECNSISDSGPETRGRTSRTSAKSTRVASGQNSALATDSGKAATDIDKDTRAKPSGPAKPQAKAVPSTAIRCAVQVHSAEYAYADGEGVVRGVHMRLPGFVEPQWRLRMAIKVGETSLPPEQVQNIAQNLAVRFPIDLFDPVYRNGHHFAAMFCQHLSLAPLQQFPEWLQCVNDGSHCLDDDDDADSDAKMEAVDLSKIAPPFPYACKRRADLFKQEYGQLPWDRCPDRRKLEMAPVDEPVDVWLDDRFDGSRLGCHGAPKEKIQGLFPIAGYHQGKLESGTSLVAVVCYVLRVFRGRPAAGGVYLVQATSQTANTPNPAVQNWYAMFVRSLF